MTAREVIFYTAATISLITTMTYIIAGVEWCLIPGCIGWLIMMGAYLWNHK